MVLCGNICSSGFYSDDVHVQGAEGLKAVRFSRSGFRRRELQSVSFG